MRRLRVKLRPAVLAGLLSALALAPAAAKNVKPDPDGLPPHDVKDLHYGDVLFYFYQDDYFDSITRLLAAQQLERLPHTEGEAELLASCYRTALDLAVAHRLASIAFPAISTGVYRFPPDHAARIAVGTVAAELAASPRGIARVVFCCFAQAAADHHSVAFADLGLA